MRSEGANVGQPFAAVDPGDADKLLIVFHPLDYNYAAVDDPFEAHILNMAWIYSQIEKRAEEALERLDKLVDDLNMQYEPKTFLWLPNVEITELEDGTLSMSAQPVGYIRSADFLLPYKEKTDD